MLAKGMRFVFIVDDNLIGNKKAIKEVCVALLSGKKEKDIRYSLPRRRQSI